MYLLSRMAINLRNAKLLEAGDENSSKKNRAGNTVIGSGTWLNQMGTGWVLSFFGFSFLFLPTSEFDMCWPEAEAEKTPISQRWPLEDWVIQPKFSRFFVTAKKVPILVLADGNQKSGEKKTVVVGSLSVYPIIYNGFFTSQVVFSPDVWTINQ